MWSDEMDKKIQDAASNHLPPFQEKDWDRMESLLNRHLPQEKKKRPFFFGFTFLLLAGIPVLFMLTTYKRPPSLVAERISAQIETRTGSPSVIEDPVPTPTEISRDAERSVIDLSTNRTNGSNRSSTQLFTTRSNRQQQLSSSRRNEKKKWQGNPDLPATENNDNAVPSKTIVSSTAEVKESSGSQGITTMTSTGDATKNDPPISGAIADTVASKDSLPAEEKEPEEKKKSPKGNNTSGKLQINFSTGPDLSTIGMNKTGQWKMQYGIGASYALSNRWQIRTGFFVSRKLYTADSSDYHPPKNFWNYYTNLQKIDADCLVYEIPLNVIYSFSSAKKHQWFVSAGVSSYLMKEENYEYYYKNAWGGIEYRSRSIQNENDHFFSIVQLSGGYQYRFSDKLSLMTEPYFKFPVGGVGFGKVKLNNTGVLFTLGYKPFVKKK
jgi:hypothetical protein